jgi:uncharacterized membrane protein
MQLSARLSDLSPALLVVLAVIALLELALDIVALVHLYRTPGDQVVGGNKWIWVVIILVINLIGPVLYLAIGHKPAPVREAPVDLPRGRIGDIVDSLYGPADDRAPP